MLIIQGETQVKSALRTTVVIAFVLALLLADAAATRAVFTSKYPGGNDFYSRWAGGRALLLHGQNPYSAEVTRHIQQGMYGRPARPGEDQVAFAYPLYTLYLFFPLSFLPYDWAQALWMAILEFALLGAVLLALHLYRWRPRPWLLAVTALWSLLFYHGARSILLGQFAVVVFALIVVALWAIQQGRDGLAAVCLALSTVKPHMVFLLIPLLLLWAVYRRRWRLVFGFGGAMAALILSPMLLVPTWPADFVAWVVRYPGYTAIGSPVWTLTHYFFPRLGTPTEVAVDGALLVYLLYQWWTGAGIRVGAARFHWLIALTLIVTNLIALRTATTNYVVLYLPLLIIFKALTVRYPKGGAWAVAGLQLAGLVGLWALFVTTVQGDYEHPIMYLPLPFTLLAVFVAARPALTGETPS